MISVCYPVFHPKKDYLKQALLPVLAQLNGVKHAELLIYDDSGVKTDVKAWLVEWGCDSKVTYVHGGENIGIGPAWNECVKRSSQPLVHILHQDDVILDGFYRAVLNVFESNSGVDVVYNRTLFLDDAGTWQAFSTRPQKMDGIWPDFPYRLFQIDIQCPSMVLRRAVYERFGLFDVSLKYQLDVEFWSRISSGVKVYYLSQPASCFRVHNDQASTRLVSTNVALMERALCIPAYIANCPVDGRERLKIDLMNGLLSGLITRLKVESGGFELWEIGFKADFLRFLKRAALEPALRWKLPAAWFRYLTRRE